MMWYLLNGGRPFRSREVEGSCVRHRAAFFSRSKATPGGNKGNFVVRHGFSILFLVIELQRCLSYSQKVFTSYSAIISSEMLLSDSNSQLQ